VEARPVCAPAHTPPIVDTRYNLSAEIDPHNTGVLVVDLQGRQQGGRTRDAGGLVDRMGGDKDDCVIM
jgi:hypothetical protein